MNQDEIKRTAQQSWFELPLELRAYFLSLLSHNLTISIRLVYSESVSVDETLKKVYSLNELQHKISSTLMHLTQEGKLSQPDEHFLDTLYDVAQQGGCEWELALAFNYTLPAFEK